MMKINKSNKGKIVAEKEYGKDRYFGFEDTELDNKAEYLKKNNLTSIYDEDDKFYSVSSEHVIIDHENVFSKRISLTYHFGEGQKDDEMDLYQAKFKNGDFVTFFHFPLDDVPRFDDILFMSVEKHKRGFCKAFTNEELIDMQTNAPDHELLKVMNMVLRIFEDKGSIENANSQLAQLATLDK